MSSPWETEARALLVSTLREFKSWIENYDGEPEKLKDFLLARLNNFEIDKNVKPNAFYETCINTCILNIEKNRILDLFGKKK